MQIQWQAVLVAIGIGCAAARGQAVVSAARAPASEDSGPGGAALGVKVGTLGVGCDATLGLMPSLNLRAGGNYLDFKVMGDVSDVEYDLEIDFKSGMLLLDLHPGRSQWRLSGGVFLTSNEIRLEGTPTEPTEIGGNEYSPALVGTLRGKLEFEPVVPYVGIGYGNAVGASERFTFSFDLGVLFQDYEVTLTADGPAAAFPQFQRDLKDEEKKIQDDLDSFRIYPVLSIGVAFRF